MKLWRKMAKKTDGIGNGRKIKYQMQMEEMMFKNLPKKYPLLDALFERAGITYALSKQQQSVLARMIENTKVKQEKTNEAE